MDINKFFSDNIVQPMVSAKDAFLSFFSSLASTVSNCGQTALDYVSSWANYFAPSLFGRVSVQGSSKQRSLESDSVKGSSEQPPFEADRNEFFQELCAIAINNEDQQQHRVEQNGLGSHNQLKGESSELRNQGHSEQQVSLMGSPVQNELSLDLLRMRTSSNHEIELDFTQYSLNDQRTIVEAFSGFISKNPNLTNGRLIKFLTGDVILPSLDNHNIGFPQKGSLKNQRLNQVQRALKSGLTSYQTIESAVITAIFLQYIGNLAVLLSKNPYDQSS